MFQTLSGDKQSIKIDELLWFMWSFELWIQSYEFWEIKKNMSNKYWVFSLGVGDKQWILSDKEWVMSVDAEW